MLIPNLVLSLIQWEPASTVPTRAHGWGLDTWLFVVPENLTELRLEDFLTRFLICARECILEIYFIILKGV